MQLPEATQSAYDKNSRRLHMTLTGRTLNGIIRKNSCMWVSAGIFSQEKNMNNLYVILCQLKAKSNHHEALRLGVLKNSDNSDFNGDFH